jgi:hypothetical protein
MINQNAEENTSAKDPATALATFRKVIGIGIVVVLVYALHNGLKLDLFKIAGTAIIVAGASLSVTNNRLRSRVFR